MSSVTLDSDTVPERGEPIEEGGVWSEGSLSSDCPVRELERLWSPLVAAVHSATVQDLEVWTPEPQGPGEVEAAGSLLGSLAV